MVFGEPNLEVKDTKEGKLEVEIKGLDIYDPTTGEIRSNTTDDIACWFVDTNYNRESFFVRHAYFTGGDKPYEKLKRALRAEIYEAAWSMLYSTKSRPFDPPSTGKIAIKVINHYGDEVLKVYEVDKSTPTAAGQKNKEHFMPVSELRLIKNCIEYRDKSHIKKIPRRTRGVYVLYKKRPR